MERHTTQAIAAIAEDIVSGAVEIAEKSADVLLSIARPEQGDAPIDLGQQLLTAGWALIRAHPTMAPLVNLINAMLWKTDSADSPQAAARAVIDAAHEFKRRLRVHEVAIAEWALRLIPDEGQVLTNGRSTTVRAALDYAQRAGRRFHVICAEGRPGCEGRTMAAEIAATGIPVTFMIDALAIAQVKQAQLVLVGADHLTSQGLVNKVGTYGIALAAQAAKVPVYALCSSEKFFPPGYIQPPQAQWPAEQVWDEAPAHVTIANYYYDSTPLESLAGIITEQGIVPAVGIEAWLAAIKAHPALRQI